MKRREHNTMHYEEGSIISTILGYEIPQYEQADLNG